MGSEIEVKLDITPQAAAAIEQAGLLGGAPLVEDLRSIYFDTADHALAAAGLSLRIRRAGDRRIQTVKASGGSTAGLFARSEWERPVEGDVPILDDTTPIRAVIGDAADAIAPLFEVRIERRLWNVAEGDAAIELVVDRGEVRAGDRVTPIVEIELELKQGEPLALFAMARRLDAVAPVRLGVRSKSERGYDLADAAHTAFKAERIALTGDMTAETAFQHIVRSCIRQFRLNEALLLQGGHPEALHQARVALRRMRSAFTVFKPLIGGADAARLQHDLRSLAATLGEARDLDVLLDRADPGDLHDRIAAAREASYARVGEALDAPWARALMLDVLQWVTAGDWLAIADTAADRHRPVREFAIAALDRFRRKVKKDGHDLVHADDEARHDVRKDAKKLRYAAEFFRALFERKRERRRYKRFVGALEALQDQLGALNDLASAPAVLDRIGLAGHADAIGGSGPGKKALVRAAADAHEDLIDTKRFWR